MKMKKKNLTEGRKMFWSVMTIFIVFIAIFILFDDYGRHNFQPLDEPIEWHLMLVAVLMLFGLGWLLHYYAQRMDWRIRQQQDEQVAETRRQMTQNISHELKTPVASILGFTETLMTNPNISEEQQRQFIARTNFQAQRLSALLTDLSTLNRMDYASDQLRRERVDISALVADIGAEVAFRLQERQMNLRDCLPSDIIVMGHPELLYSIFRNLFENAINYAGKGTTIEISATKFPSQSSNEVTKGQFWRFSFSDNGVGVPEAHLDHIFDRFYRIDKGRSRSMGGTGLGLAIVKNAVLLHGGTISASQSSGGGLHISFSLPIPS